MRPWLCLLLSLPLLGQTRVRPEQLTLPDLVPVESKWCPPPALEVAPNRTLLQVGRSWSAATPCYLHFNITPPLQIDPVTVSSFLEPVTIDILPSFTGDDEVYLWASAPTSAANPTKLFAATRQNAVLSCNGCTGGIITQPIAPRTFPANSVPIGFAVIRGGKFLPKADDILSRQQVYLGPGSAMTLRGDQGGYWFELSPAVAQAAVAAQTKASQEAALATYQARAMATAPVGDEKLAQVQAQLDGMEKELMRMNERIPPDPKQAEYLRMELQHLGQMAQNSMQNVMEESRWRAQSADAVFSQALTKEARVPVPADPAASCPSLQTWAADKKFLYRCVGKIGAVYLPGQPLTEGRWVRYPYDGKWSKLPER